jgi:RNA polymerase sigma-54 factor
MQIQVIKMLEYPSIELEERIREEMVDNPALELDSTEGADDIFGEEEREPERPSADDLEWHGMAMEMIMMIEMKYQGIVCV